MEKVAQPDPVNRYNLDNISVSQMKIFGKRYEMIRINSTSNGLAVRQQLSGQQRQVAMQRSFKKGKIDANRLRVSRAIATVGPNSARYR